MDCWTSPQFLIPYIWGQVENYIPYKIPGDADAVAASLGTPLSEALVYCVLDKSNRSKLSARCTTENQCQQSIQEVIDFVPKELERSQLI